MDEILEAQTKLLVVLFSACDQAGVLERDRTYDLINGLASDSSGLERAYLKLFSQKLLPRSPRTFSVIEGGRPS